MSSRLIHVTVVPACTISVCGRKLKLSMVTTLARLLAGDGCVDGQHHQRDGTDVTEECFLHGDLPFQVTVAVSSSPGANR